MQGKNTSNNKGIIEHRSYCHKSCMSASPVSNQKIEPRNLSKIIYKDNFLNFFLVKCD